MITKAGLKERQEAARAAIRERDQTEENTLILAERCLTEGEFDKARRLVFDNMYRNRGKAETIFKKFLPKVETCPECQVIIKPLFNCLSLKWESPPCSNCSYLSVKAKIKDSCSEIMESRGIPKRFLGARLNDFPKQYQKISQGDSGIFLHGPRGVGKTHLMAAILHNEILKTEPQEFKGSSSDILYDKPFESIYPFFLTAPELLLEIRSTFGNQGGTDEQRILEKYSTVKCLFLDDLGTEKATDWAVQTLFLLIDRRYGEMLRTVISSNLNLDQLAGRLDDRITSRIAEMCEVVKIDGKDRRVK